MKLVLARLESGQPEIFRTLQGEGPHSGRESLFVRLSGCNLHCHWCDTAYTWNFEGTAFEHRDGRKYRRGDNAMVLDVAEVAARLAGERCRNVVLTGGEPLLQMRALTQLMTALRQEDPAFFFEIETNGTIRPDEAFDALANHYNVSPKLENSRNPADLRERPEVLSYFARNPKAVFKFVIQDETDLEEVLALAARHGLPHARLYLMPEGTAPGVLTERRIWIADACLRHGVNFSDRLHIHLYGHQRGR